MTLQLKNSKTTVREKPRIVFNDEDGVQGDHHPIFDATLKQPLPKDTTAATDSSFLANFPPDPVWEETFKNMDAIIGVGGNEVFNSVSL
jgi:hypothetical protein